MLGSACVLRKPVAGGATQAVQHCLLRVVQRCMLKASAGIDAAETCSRTNEISALRVSFSRAGVRLVGVGSPRFRGSARLSPACMNARLFAMRCIYASCRPRQMS